MSEANSELLLILFLLFLKFTRVLTKKLPRRIERKRDEGLTTNYEGLTTKL